MVRNYLSVMCSLAICLPLLGTPSSQTREVKVSAGQTADLWLGVNVTGKVHYAIRARDGSNKMRMWWILEPLGTVKQLGTLSGSGSLDIPGKVERQHLREASR